MANDNRLDQLIQFPKIGEYIAALAFFKAFFVKK